MAKINKNTIKILAIGLMALSFAVFSVDTVKAEGISTNDVIKLLNQSRLASGLGEVKENPKLNQAARAKAEDMVKNDYFAHTSPTGVDPWHWFKNVGYEYKFAGENLAVNYASAEAQHKAWMKSPTHRKNILNESYQEVGVAVVESNIDGEKALLTVELFGTPFHVPVSAAPEEAQILPETQKVAGEETAPIEISAVPAVAPLVSPKINSLEVVDSIWLIAFVVFSFTLMAGPLVILSKSWKILAKRKIILKNHLVETVISKAPA